MSENFGIISPEMGGMFFSVIFFEGMLVMNVSVFIVNTKYEESLGFRKSRIPIGDRSSYTSLVLDKKFIAEKSRHPE